jgi:hypothetical protein
MDHVINIYQSKDNNNDIQLSRIHFNIYCEKNLSIISFVIIVYIWLIIYNLFFLWRYIGGKWIKYVRLMCCFIRHDIPYMLWMYSGNGHKDEKNVWKELSLIRIEITN